MSFWTLVGEPIGDDDEEEEWNLKEKMPSEEEAMLFRFLDNTVNDLCIAYQSLSNQVIKHRTEQIAFASFIFLFFFFVATHWHNTVCHVILECFLYERMIFIRKIQE